MFNCHRGYCNSWLRYIKQFRYSSSRSTIGQTHVDRNLMINLVCSCCSKQRKGKFDKVQLAEEKCRIFFQFLWTLFLSNFLPFLRTKQASIRYLYFYIVRCCFHYCLVGLYLFLSAIYVVKIRGVIKKKLEGSLNFQSLYSEEFGTSRLTKMAVGYMILVGYQNTVVQPWFDRGGTIIQVLRSNHLYCFTITKTALKLTIVLWFDCYGLTMVQHGWAMVRPW